MGGPTLFRSLGSKRGHVPFKLPRYSYLLRKPIEKGIPHAPSRDVPEVQFGQQIYLYKNRTTNQVVYSLSRHLNNKDSLDQLPFLGKKTVPSRLRKDLWTPFAMVYFPSPHAGLNAYRKLREFRRLHETAYDLDDIRHEKGQFAGQLYSIKRHRKRANTRGRALMNQKANSIADLAAVLFQQEEGPSEARIESQERRIKRVEKLKQQKGATKVNKSPVDLKKEFDGVDGVWVRWVDIADAEYAESWPEGVLHDTLLKERYTAAWPLGGRRPVREQERELGREQEREQEQKQGWWEYISSWIPGRTHSTVAASA